MIGTGFNIKGTYNNESLISALRGTSCVPPDLILHFDKAILSKLIKDTFADWNRAEFVDVSLVAPAKVVTK